MLVDLGSGSGTSIKQYLQANQAQQQNIQIQAFEPDHTKIAELKASLAQIKHQQQATVHEAAAWVKDEMVMPHVSPASVGGFAEIAEVVDSLSEVLD